MEGIARSSNAAAVPRGRARARAEDIAVQEPPVEEARALSGETVSVRVTPIEWILYGAFTVIGAIMRFWDLGSRALHHDESLHATYSWYLWEKLTGTNAGAQYWYDPMMHGPYQFHGNALMYLIFGPSNAAARMNAAICGTALIILPFLLRRQLGRVASLILSALFAFSPAFLYYSRFSREDIYFALWTAIFFVGFMRWLDARGRPGGHRWLYLAAAGFALSWATKESTYFSAIIALGFLAGVFVVAYAYQFLAPARPQGKRTAVRENLLVATLGDFSRANLPPVVEAFRGTPALAWLYSVVIMAVITFVLFLPIGAPWQWGFIPGYHTQGGSGANGQAITYNTDFLTGGLSYWQQQQSAQRGGQPWYYYFLVIPLYEQVAVVFGAAGLVYYLLAGRQRTRLTTISGVVFLVVSLLVLFGGEAVAGQDPARASKLEALGLLVVIAAFVPLLVSRPRSLLLNFVLWWTVVTWGLYIYAGEKMPWLTLHILLPTFFVAALYAGHLLTALPRRGLKWLLVAALLAVTALISFRSSVALAYVDGANPTEMLVYTQTSQDVPNVNNVIQRIPLLPTTTGSKARVWVDSDSSWPWVWYLRNDSSNHGWSNGSAVVSAAQQRYPVLMIGDADLAAMRSSGQLAQITGSYTGYKFKLRWWFPEDGYKAWETTGLGGFLSQAVQPSTWGNLFNWWATRTPFDQQAFKNWNNVTSFYVYVRNDLVKQYVPASWSTGHPCAVNTNNVYTLVSSHQCAVADSAGAGTPSAPASANDVPDKLTRPVMPVLTINGNSLSQPMAVIRAVAVDASGNIYLTDSASQRVVKLDRGGHFVTAWGSTGSGPGQFANIHGGPMGIAVGPNGHVYVSDTWNHRVEEFTAGGRFVRAFGHPNPPNNAPPTADSFFGPRQLAVAPNGNIYVADTGNERIQVYSPNGAHLFNIGAGSHNVETALGRFDEPSGIAIDAHGTVYVADYWDKRIQRFTLSGMPAGAAFAIPGWIVGDYNEPYLAVDTKGHLFATDAPIGSGHANHILEMDAATGHVIRAFGTASGTTGALSQPSGVATGPDGALYIADAGTVRLLKVLP